MEKPNLNVQQVGQALQGFGKLVTGFAYGNEAHDGSKQVVELPMTVVVGLGEFLEWAGTKLAEGGRKQ